MPRIELDPSLIGGGGNAFAAAYQNAMANNFKNQAAQQDIDINQYKMDAARQEQQQSNALAQLLGRQGFDAKTPQGQSELYSAGGVKNTQTYLKGQGDLAKVNAETADKTAGTRKTDIENSFKRLELVGQFLGGSTDQATHTQMRAQMAANPELAEIAKMIPEQYDPNAVAMFKKMSMPEKDRLAAEHQQITRDETKRSNLAGEKISVDNNVLNNKTSRDNNFDNNARMASDAAAGRGVTMRGQNMTDARSREGNATASAGGGVFTAGGKAPTGYRWKTDGELEAIPGGPAGKTAASTEGERKAATLLQRLEGSEKQLSKALTENPGAAKPGVMASGLRSVGAESLANTVAVGSERQRAESAQLDILDAALTLGTGAAYTKEQLEGYRKSYFPQIGDTKDNVRDKQERLTNIIKAAKIAAGRSASQVTGATGGGGFDADKESRYQAWKAGQGK